MMKTKILTLGLICLFVFVCCNSPADPEIEKALNPDTPSAEVVMKGIPHWSSSVYLSTDPVPIAYFGVSSSYDGRLENVGTKIAYEVRMKMTLYDPDGIYLADKYVTFWNADLVPIGTLATLYPDEHIEWKCFWVKDENMELFEQLQHTGNPNRPDVNPDKCFLITWK